MIDSPYSPIESGKKILQFATGNNIDLGIVGGNTFGRYKKISSEETFNMIVSDGALVSFPGYKKRRALEGSLGREIYTSYRFKHMIAVVDDNVYSISSDLSTVLIGSLSTFSGDVFIAENLGGQIAICDGENIYIFNYINSSFQKVVVDFLPGYIEFQDTYFIASDRRTNQFRLSANNDGTSWPADAGHVGQIQTKATNCVAAKVLDRQLYVFGQTVTEPWYDVGYTLFPYQRTNYFNIDYGCVSPATIASAFGAMVWLGSNEKTGISIMLSQGGPAQRLSNDGMDFIFSNMKNPFDAFGFLFRESGHIFYVITFPTDNISYVYDFNTKMFFTLVDKDMNHHIARRITFFNGKYYFISLTDGDLYEISSLLYMLDDHEMPRFRILKHLRVPSCDRFGVRNISLTMEQGILENENKNDLSILPISIPRIDLSISKDGGESYWNVGSKKMNRFGRRANNCNFWNIGSSNDLTLKFAFWGNQRWCINGAIGNVYQ